LTDDLVTHLAPDLAAAKWPDVEAGPRSLLVVPLGSLEQHGPHLPLDTDTRIACAVAARVCAGRPGVGLAPPVAIGASGEHADFPGTLSIGILAVTSALKTLRAEGRDCHVWHAGLPSPLADAHAGRFETSLMLALAPQDVRLSAAAPGDTRPLAEIMPLLTAGGVRAVSPNGVLGDPSGACAREGAELLDALTAALASVLEALLREVPLREVPLRKRFQ
jgi:creatinine amidohydrolase/Fe(II)-dependent formamide hydrolase-like protein